MDQRGILGQGNPGCLEASERGEAEVALDFGDGDGGFGFAPEGELESDRVGANVLHLRVEAFVSNDLWMGGGYLLEDLNGLLDRGGGGDGDGHFQSAGLALKGVVHNDALENHAVRNEDFHAVVAVELAAAGSNRGDGAGGGADFDEVANADRAFEEKNEAADEIVGELLGAEADRDGGGSAEEGENGEWDLDGRESDQADKEEEGVVCKFLDDRAGGGVEALAEAGAQPAAQGGREDSADQKDHEGGEEHSEGDRTRALDELAIHIDRVAESEERGFPDFDHPPAEGVHCEVEEGGARRAVCWFGGVEGMRQRGEQNGGGGFLEKEWCCHGKKSR